MAPPHPWFPTTMRSACSSAATLQELAVRSADGDLRPNRAIERRLVRDERVEPSLGVVHEACAETRDVEGYVITTAPPDGQHVARSVA